MGGVEGEDRGEGEVVGEVEQEASVDHFAGEVIAVGVASELPCALQGVLDEGDGASEEAGADGVEGE